MTLPVLVTVFEHFYQQDRATTSLRQKASRYALLWAMAALYLAVRGILLGGVASVDLRPGLSWYEVGLSAVSLSGEYLWKLLWPAHLSAFYVFHKSGHLADRSVLLGLAGLVLCGIAFAALWRRARILSFALLLIFLPLGPVLNARWMPASVFAERYLYLPSIGFCWILGWAAATLWSTNAPALVGRLCRVASLLLVAIAVPYAAETVMRNQDWRTERELYRRTLHTQADASLMRSNLGAIYFDNGDMAGAEHEWLKALTAGPANVFVLDNLALLRQRQHRYIEALDYSWRTLRARPAFAVAHIHLAETLALMGRGDEADWQFRIATALSPLSTRVHNSYGKFLLDSGRLGDARTEYERSVAVDPTTEAYDRLGDVYLALLDRPRAEQAFRHALSMNPFDSHAHFVLGQLLEATGKPGDALREIESGLAMDPSNLAGKAAAKRLRGGTPPPSPAPPR
jgi:Tfp pilus assembly protein PilF